MRIEHIGDDPHDAVPEDRQHRLGELREKACGRKREWVGEQRDEVGALERGNSRDGDAVVQLEGRRVKRLDAASGERGRPDRCAGPVLQLLVAPDHALGHAADIRPVLSEARCCVVPIRIGGGTRLKILDAWAMGKAVVSTSVGCEGLDVVDGENILVRDEPQAFAEAVLQVLGDARLRSRLERNARRTATETYSWRGIGERIRSAYGELLGRSASPPGRPGAAAPSRTAYGVASRS